MTDIHGAPLTRAEKDALIDVLEDKIDELQRSEAAKYRRLDCVRVAQKHLEDLGTNDLISTAANIADFVENGTNVHAGTQLNSPR